MCMHACVYAYVHLLTFSLNKTSPQKLLTGLLPNFIVVFLEVKIFSSSLQKKTGLWSNKGAQVPLVTCLQYNSLKTPREKEKCL